MNSRTERTYGMGGYGDWQCLAGRFVFSCQSSVFSTSVTMFGDIVAPRIHRNSFQSLYTSRQLQHLILNAYSLLVLEDLVAEPPSMA